MNHMIKCKCSSKSWPLHTEWCSTASTCCGNGWLSWMQSLLQNGAPVISLIPLSKSCWNHEGCTCSNRTSNIPGTNIILPSWHMLLCHGWLYWMQHLRNVAEPNTGYISTHLVGIMRGIKHSETAKENGNYSRKTRTPNVTVTCIVQEL